MILNGSMARPITPGNLIAAGVVALLVVPAMFTSCVTHVAPGGLGFTAPLVCPEGSHMRFTTVSQQTNRGRRESDRAYCVDARGSDVGGDVYPKSFGIVYGVTLLAWGAVLALVFRPAKSPAA